MGFRADCFTSIENSFMRVSSFKPQTSLRRLRFVLVLLGLSIAAVPLWSRAQEAAQETLPAELVAAAPIAAH